MNNLIKNLKKSVCKSEKRSKESRSFILLVAISVAALIMAEAALSFPELPVWGKIGISLAHVPFTILVAVFGWRVLKGLDELQRLIHMQAFIIAITAAGAILLSYTLLMSAGLVAGDMIWQFWGLLWIFYSLGYGVVSRRY